MASFVNANLGSDSDSDDQDYDPTKEAGHVVSEEENSGDEENAESGTKKLKKSKKKRKEGGRIGGIFLEEDEQTKAENEAKRKEFEQEKIELAQEAEKQNSEIKASKDIKRLTEERNAAMQKFSLIMSERDSVHKEIEKLQEEIKEKNKKLASHEGRNKHYDDEVNKEKTQLSTSLLDNAPNKIIVGCIIQKRKYC